MMNPVIKTRVVAFDLDDNELLLGDFTQGVVLTQNYGARLELVDAATLGVIAFYDPKTIRWSTPQGGEYPRVFIQHLHET